MHSALAVRPLLAHDYAAALAELDLATTSLGRNPSGAPVCVWGLWVVLRAVQDADPGAAMRQLAGSQAVHRSLNTGALRLAEAVVAGREGRADDAAALVVDGEEQMAGADWWTRLLRLLVLEAALADGWGDPVPLLRADLTAFEAAGDKELARTCRELLRRGGVTVRRGRGESRVPGWAAALGITSREMDVLELVAGGATNAEVAARLHLSTRTVEHHVARVLAKSGCADRRALARWSIDRSGRAHRLRRPAVAHPAHGLQRVAHRVAELRAQPVHVHVDRPAAVLAAPVPERRQQRSPGVHPVGRRDQVGQQVELEPGQLELTALHGSPSLVDVDPQLSRQCVVVDGRAGLGHQRQRRPGRRAAGDRQSGLPPGLEPADDVGGPVDADLLQGRRREAGRVALGAEHDHVQVVRRDRQPRLTGRVEPPLEHVALDEHGAGHVALLGALRGRSDVDEDGTVEAGRHRADRVQPEQSGPGAGEQVDDRLRGYGCGGHQSVPECSSETTCAWPSSSRTYLRMVSRAGA